MSKIKETKGSKWKPLKLEGSVFSTDIAGLIGIEELTDYKLENDGQETKILNCTEKIKNVKKVPEKRKTSCKWQEDSIEDAQLLPKKAKVKIAEENTFTKKSKKKTKLSVKAELNDSLAHENQISAETNDNEIDNADINIHAWSTLGVPMPIIRALSDQHFELPTNIQALTLAPAILGRRDILGAAETGSGKTLAFGIPIINGILELKKKLSDESQIQHVEDETNENTENKGWICSKEKIHKNEDSNSSSESDTEENNDCIDGNGIGCVRVINNIEINNPRNYVKKPLFALILTPTRELAIQIKNHLTKAAKYTDIKIAVVVGGMAAVKQERILSKGPEIVIATPGRLWELIQQGNPHLNQVDSIKYLAIDETDRMLEKGHFQELQQLLGKINMNEKKLKERQTFVFSATLTMVHDIPEYLERKKKRNVKSKIYKLTPGQKLQKIIILVGIKNPKIVDVTKESGTATNLTECRIACTIDHKDYYLYYFLKKHSGRTLVFCNSIGCVKRLATLFGILDCKPLPLHASMQQRQRLHNLERFQEDENGLLIATDVAARGLDIPNVEHVIHYQVPRTSESYVHRSGRTARGEKEGITVLMMEPTEKHNYSKLCKTLGRTQDIPTFPVVDRLLIAVKGRVDIAREIDKLELKCRKENAQKGWLRKAVEEMDIILENYDEDEATFEAEEMACLKQQLKVKRRQLTSLLAKPLFPKGFSGKYPEINVEFNLDQDNQKAVDVMKQAIEEYPMRKKEKCIKSQKKRNFLRKKKQKSKRT